MCDSPKEPPNITYENDTPDDERPLFRDLLSRAHNMGLTHIKTKAISISDPPERRAVFKATVTMRIEDELLDFVGHGDCDDKNTHALIAPHYIRMAEYAWPKPEPSPGRYAGPPTRGAPVRRRCRLTMG